MEGICTPFDEKYQKEIGIPRNVEAYIQTMALRRTAASRVASRGRSLSQVGCNGEELSTRVAGFIGAGNGNVSQQSAS